MLRYGDRLRKPECYGNAVDHNRQDPDCQRCDFFDDCRDSIDRKRSRSVPINRPSRVDTRSEMMRSETRAGIIKEGESAGERFLRDCMTGACRGASWEAYEFFCKFRF